MVSDLDAGHGSKAAFREMAGRAWVARHEWFHVDMVVVAGSDGAVIVDTHGFGRAALGFLSRLADVQGMEFDASYGFSESSRQPWVGRDCRSMGFEPAGDGSLVDEATRRWRCILKLHARMAAAVRPGLSGQVA